MSAVAVSEPSNSAVSYRRWGTPAEAARQASALEAPVWCYGVSADPSPGLLPRVLEYVAKRGLVPLALHAGRCLERGPHGVEDTLAVDLQVDGLDRDTASHVRDCLGQIVGVRHVAMSLR